VTQSPHPSVPRWAIAVAVVLFVGALGVFVFGRGGAAVLTAVALAFCAFAVLLLSLGDSLPDEE